MLTLFGKLFGAASPASTTETTSRVTVRNGSRAPLLVIFEPWCDTFELAPDVEYVFEATSPRPGWLEVEYTGDAVTVYAWDACVGKVRDREGIVIDSLDVRVPDFIGLDEQRRGRDPGAAL
jgi:hypothetical protein